METENVPWAEQYRIRWGKSWRFLTTRAALLEEFKPRFFSLADDGLQLRFARDCDLFLTEDSLNFRLLGEVNSRSVEPIVAMIVDMLEVDHVHSVTTDLAFLREINDNYDTARKRAVAALNPSLSQDVIDFAMVLEITKADSSGQFEFGVVTAEEAIKHLASTVSTSEDFFKTRTPAWMKVRLPKVGLFMSASQETNDLKSVGDESNENVARYCSQLIQERRDYAFQRFRNLYQTITYESSKGGLT